METTVDAGCIEYIAAIARYRKRHAVVILRPAQADAGFGIECMAVQIGHGERLKISEQPDECIIICAQPGRFEANG